MEYDLDKIREYIARCKWRWSTTMKNIPHQYIHRDQCPLSRDEFYYIVKAQREIGIPEKWRNYNHTYLYVDGYKYWTMGDEISKTFILNRQKVFKQFDNIDWPIRRIYTPTESKLTSIAIVRAFSKMQILEIGVGNGDFVKDSNIDPVHYSCLEPSKKAVQKFREKCKGYSRKVSNVSFEEAFDKWKDGGFAIIALFGTASFIMEEYLKELAKSGNDYCLMFFKEDYKPVEYEGLFYFFYTKEQIKSIFPKAYISNHKNFYTFSSRPLNWKDIVIESELFPV